MFIYNGKAISDNPIPKTSKKFKVSIEDVLLSFLCYEIRGNKVYITYSVSYFNIPQNVKEYEIDRNIDFDSLKKVINETVNDLGRFIKLDTFNSKQVKLVFDVKYFLEHASYPARVVNQRKIYQTVLKLNQPLPELIKQIDTGDIKLLISNVMTSMIRNDRKYRYIFEHMRSWTYSKSTVVEAQYDMEHNEFLVEIKDPFKMIYYYLNK